VETKRNAARPCCGVWDNRLVLPAVCGGCRTPARQAVAERRDAAAERGRPVVYNEPRAMTSPIFFGFLVWFAALVIASIVAFLVWPTASIVVVLALVLLLRPLSSSVTRMRMRRLHRRAAEAGYHLCPSCLHQLGEPEDGISVCPECGAAGVSSDIVSHWRSLARYGAERGGTARP
jgi:hypothetical protein